jgi:hypothetical protein
MNINLAPLAPYIWFLAALLAVVLIFIAIRFYWRHILKYVVQGCLGIVVIILLLALLHYFKVF